jgi:toxin ParE1/3/4
LKEISYSLRAESDRIAHLEYLAQFNVSAAVRIDQEVESQVNVLRRFPLSGRAGRVEGTRELPVSRTPLVVVYEIHGSVVVIIRILHGAQSWPARF